VRVSFGQFNTCGDADALVAAVRQVEAMQAVCSSVGRQI
jgi:selenocysteine lyase/cysteine desulfurase